MTAIQPPRRRMKSAEVSITIQQLVLLNGNMAPLNAVWRIRRHLSPERSSDVRTPRSSKWICTQAALIRFAF